tara:strand:+ start:278 stop:550 length:273 start_codon:yes stop_codon:yes gene_type:complete
MVAATAAVKTTLQTAPVVLVVLAVAVGTVLVHTPTMRAVRLPQVKATLVALALLAQRAVAVVAVKAALARLHQRLRIPPTAGTVAQRAQV